MVVPDWSNQPWYSECTEIILGNIIFFPTLPQKDTKHLLHNILQLRAATELRHETPTVAHLVQAAWALKTSSTYDTFINK